MGPLLAQILGQALECHGPGLERALDGQKLVPDLLAIQVLDDVVCQADVLKLAKGVALRSSGTKPVEGWWDTHKAFRYTDDQERNAGLMLLAREPAAGCQLLPDGDMSPERLACWT